MKTCRRCKQTKTKDQFSRFTHQHTCKECRLFYTTQYDIRKNKKVPLKVKKMTEQQRIRSHIRSVVYNALKYTISPSLAEKYLGCSTVFAKEYIQSKFDNGMTWDNWGEWELDHIIPVNTFDLTVEVNTFAVSHYTNLQPLWKKDHIKKSSKERKIHKL